MAAGVGEGFAVLAEDFEEDLDDLEGFDFALAAWRSGRSDKDTTPAIRREKNRGAVINYSKGAEWVP